MHINPNEDPVAGKESEILFLINDKDKKFQPENCDCQASVMFGTTTLLNQQVSTAKTSYRGIFAPAIAFTFPQKGIYSIKLMGEPKNEQSFQKFSITYSIKVDRDANTTPTPPFKKSTKLYYNHRRPNNSHLHYKIIFWHRRHKRQKILKNARSVLKSRLILRSFYLLYLPRILKYL